MKIDLKKLYAACAASGVTKRRLFGSFGGRRRVEAWAKTCNPRMLAGVGRVLSVDINTLLVVEQTKTVAPSVTVEKVVKAPEIQKTVKVADKPLSKMSKEELIVKAHTLKPGIDLPDKATNKELREIIKGL